MKRYLAFAKKEFLHLLRDRRTMLILFIMPIVQVLLFGFALSTEVKDINLAVIDLSEDGITQQITQTLSANELFEIIKEPISLDAGEDAVKRGDADALLIIPTKLEQSLLRGDRISFQLMVDATNPNTAQIVRGYVSHILGQTLKNITRQSKAPLVDVHTDMLFNPELKSTFNFVPGVFGFIMILICTVMTSVAIAREKEHGSWEVLLISPIRPNTIVFAKILPYTVLSFVNTASILALSYFVMNVPIRGSLTLLCFITLLYILLSLSIGILISTIVSKQTDANLAAGIGMMMPTLLLSGMIFPIASMPVALQYLSMAVPARWYIDAIRGIMIQGVSFMDIWVNIAILAGMNVVVLLVALRNIKPRLD